MSYYHKISVDEYLIDGYEITIDGYSETLINEYQIIVSTDMCM